MRAAKPEILKAAGEFKWRWTARRDRCDPSVIASDASTHERPKQPDPHRRTFDNPKCATDLIQDFQDFWSKQTAPYFVSS